jgi:CelD/BcsL family acetyltransferase involved in cellulose biosynthesis
MLAVDTTRLTLDFAIEVEPDFDFLSDAYRAVFARSVGAPFQAPLWLAMMHRRLAPQLGARQHTITVRQRGDGRLLAVLPMVLQRSRGVTLLQAADFGLCDSNAPVGDRQVLEAIAADAAARARIAALLGTGDALLVRKVRRDGFDYARLLPKAHKSPAENAAYDVAVEEDFDLWRRRVLRRQMTKEIGRLGRQLEKSHGAYDTRLATTPEEIGAAFEFLRSVRDGRFDDDLLLNPIYFEFYRDYAIAAAAAGEARTYVSTLAGRPVAALFGLDSDGEFHALQLGHDSASYGRYSLGLQIIYRTIKLRHDEGKRYFDMGLGNTGYKTHFRVDETRLDNISAARTLRGAAVDLIYRRAKPVKNLLRRLSPVR